MGNIKGIDTYMKKMFKNTIITVAVVLVTILPFGIIVKAVDNDHINNFNGEDYGDSEEHLEQMEEDLKAAGYECFTVGYSYNEEWSANESFQGMCLLTGEKTRAYCIPTEVEAFINDGGNEEKLTLMHNTYIVNYSDFWSSEEETATAVFQADISNAFEESHPDAEITVNVSTGSSDKSYTLSAENEYMAEEQTHSATFYLIQSVEISDGLRSEYAVEYPERVDFVLGETATIIITIDGGASSTNQPEESVEADPADDTADSLADETADEPAVSTETEESSGLSAVLIVIAVVVAGVIGVAVIVIKKKNEFDF